MTNDDITYLVGGGCLVLGLACFVALVVAPAMSSFRTLWEKGAALVLSVYILAALTGIGVLVGVIIVEQWPSIS
jgi:hypothetical protein